MCFKQGRRLINAGYLRDPWTGVLFSGTFWDLLSWSVK